MRQEYVNIICLFVLGMLTACSHSVPKPDGYFRIDLPEHRYRPFDEYSEFIFEISDQALIEPVRDVNSGEWFNIVYPALNAKVYCAYLPITPETFGKAAEDSRNFVYKHVIKADAIDEYLYEAPQHKVYGIVYQIQGNVASPLQFVLTDSVRSFFRGALYFEHAPNQDSVAPVLRYLREDVQCLIESFRWQ